AQPPAVAPELVVQHTEICVASVVDLHLACCARPPYRRIERLTIQNVGLEQLEPPALTPKLVVLRLILRERGCVHLHFSFRARPPALTPKLVVLRLVLRVRGAVDLVFPFCARTPYGVVQGLSVRYVHLQRVEPPALRPELIVLRAIRAVGNAVHLDLLLSSLGP